MAARIGKSFRITKDGKVAKSTRRLAVSEVLRQKHSKKVRVVKRGTT